MDRNSLIGRLHGDIPSPIDSIEPVAYEKKPDFIPQSLIDCKAKKRKKIAIVGFATSYSKAPFNDDSWEIWGLNELYLMIPRYDRWFEIHSREACGGSERNKEHIKWLEQAKVPVYMWDHDDAIPNSVRYPIDEMLRVHPRYFTNSISYMIALAVEEAKAEGVIDTIGIWGVDMCMAEEYASQRPSVEYFIGYAMGAGLNVYVHEGSDVLKTPYLYGYETELPILTKMTERKEELRRRRDMVANASFQAQMQEAHAKGQVAQLEGWANRIATVEVPKEQLIREMLASRDILVKQLPQFQQQAMEAQLSMAKLDGCVDQIDYERTRWFQCNEPRNDPST